MKRGQSKDIRIRFRPRRAPVVEAYVMKDVRVRFTRRALATPIRRTLRPSPPCPAVDERPLYRAGKRLWQPAEDAVLRDRYPNEPTAKTARLLRRAVGSTYQRARKLGLGKSAEYLAGPDACRLRRGDNVGWAHRFPKGHVPANKGLRRPGWGPGRMKDAWFKKGERAGAAARNWRPVGTILTDSDGYQRIKVREARSGEAYGFGNCRVWPLRHRHVWETAHGPVPAGHAVAFKNRDRSDCRLENLELITRRELMARNTVHNLPKPLAQAIQLLGALKRQIRRKARSHAEEQDRRSP